MFCPVCKYEFRRGFTHCNTCDVDLVEALPTEGESQAGPAGMDEPTLLWRGSNAGTEFNEIAKGLDAAGIRYNREELDPRLMLSAEYAQLEIWVPAAQFAEAQRVMGEILASHAEAGEAADPAKAADPTGTWPDGDDDGQEESFVSGNFTAKLYPEDATSEVWSGKDGNMAAILKTCLAEIGVPCYVEDPHADPEAHQEADAESARSDPSKGAFAILVRPADESRAKALVRQVADNAPQG